MGDLRRDPARSSAYTDIALDPSEIGILVATYYDWSQIEETRRMTGIFSAIPESARCAILARTVS
jgi:hypothetical protein